MEALLLWLKTLPLKGEEMVGVVLMVIYVGIHHRLKSDF